MEVLDGRATVIGEFIFESPLGLTREGENGRRAVSQETCLIHILRLAFREKRVQSGIVFNLTFLCRRWGFFVSFLFWPGRHSLPAGAFFSFQSTIGVGREVRDFYRTDQPDGSCCYKTRFPIVAGDCRGKKGNGAHAIIVVTLGWRLVWHLGLVSWCGGSGGNLGGYSRVASLEVFFCISSMVIGRPGF